MSTKNWKIWGDQETNFTRFVTSDNVEKVQAQWHHWTPPTTICTFRIIEYVVEQTAKKTFHHNFFAWSDQHRKYPKHEENIRCHPPVHIEKWWNTRCVDQREKNNKKKVCLFSKPYSRGLLGGFLPHRRRKRVRRSLPRIGSVIHTHWYLHRLRILGCFTRTRVRNSNDEPAVEIIQDSTTKKQRSKTDPLTQKMTEKNTLSAHVSHNTATKAPTNCVYTFMSFTLNTRSTKKIRASKQQPRAYLEQSDGKQKCEQKSKSE